MATSTLKRFKVYGFLKLAHNLILIKFSEYGEFKNLIVKLYDSETILDSAKDIPSRLRNQIKQKLKLKVVTKPCPK